MAESANPFVRYRTRLDSYRSAQDLGWDDARFVALVERLDSAVAEVDGHGFEVTPFTEEAQLAQTLGLAGRLLVKDDTGNVSGSHKARHLFGVALHQAVQADTTEGELAIASCGNAALAAAVVARAAGRPLRVFIPTWADAAVVRRLEALRARISIEERRPGEVGDPTYLRFLEAVDAGAVPFSVQATVTPATIDGGRTMGWELADQLREAGATGVVRVFIQIGGGALAAATWAGLLEGIAGAEWRAAGLEPVLHAVQTEACAPLYRAWDALTGELEHDSPGGVAAAVLDRGLADSLIGRARAEPDRYMWAWDSVGMSAASGILDDVTYDWLPVIDGMLRSGGWPIVVPETDIVAAHHAVHAETTIDADATGTAGLAGMISANRTGDLADDDTLVALVTGTTR